MALEDYLEPEVAVAAAVSAAIFSPQVRGFLRRGLVYATAGVLMAGDALGAFARGVGEGVQEGSAAAQQAVAPGESTASAGSRAPARRRSPAKPRSADVGMSGGEDEV